MERSFSRIAQAVSEARKKKEMSQVELAKLLGYKNGQFISNVERGKCSIPVEKIFLLSKILSVNSIVFGQALITDFQLHVFESIKENTPPELPYLPPGLEERKDPGKYH